MYNYYGNYNYACKYSTNSIWDFQHHRKELVNSWPCLCSGTWENEVFYFWR